MNRISPRLVKRPRNGSKSKIKFRCEYSSTPLKVLQARGWTRIQDLRDNSWDIWWCDTSELKLALDGPTRLEAHQRVSHFRNHCELTRKNYLYRNLKRYRRLLLKAAKVREAELCNAMPMSFELPVEYRMLVEEHRRCHGVTWIVKPAAGSQGRGIFLFQRLKDLIDWRDKECVTVPEISDLDPVPSIPPPTYVVQKYIDNPYLLEGRKFDLRIYVLVTSFQPLKVWLAREGFARLSSEQFSLQRINERRIHLTNMSIQLKGDGCHKSEGDQKTKGLGRKMPLSCLRHHLTARHGVKIIDQLLRSISVKDNGNLSVQSIKKYFPNAESLAYKDQEGRMHSLAISFDDILINSEIEEYYIYTSSEARLQSTDSEIHERGNGTNGNKESNEHVKSMQDKNDKLRFADEVNTSQPQNDKQDQQSVNSISISRLIDNINGNNEVSQKSNQESDSSNNSLSQNSINEAAKQDFTKELLQEVLEKIPKSTRNTRHKTLRIGWLHKDPSDKRYSKMKKPMGGVKRLKLDELTAYSAADIKRLAIKEFNLSEHDYKEIHLGLFGGKPIDDFSIIRDNTKKRHSNSLFDNIWEYCRFRDTTPYSLNLFLLTTSKKSKLIDNVRILYHYSKLSKYSGESLYTECDKMTLHSYMIDQQFGDGPSLEEFEPIDYGYEISRVEKDGKVILQACIDNELNYSVGGRIVKTFQYPSAKVPPGSHEIVYDLDELLGVYYGNVGLGFVTSCTDACRPIFTWYRDDLVYKRAEQLYWLSDVCDGQKHIWRCVVKCKGCDREIKSKEIEISN